MSKFTEFFKAKATQIAITAVSASLVIGASAGVAIHNNNKKLEAALHELSNTSTTESVTESSSETTTESTTESTTVSTTKKTTTTTTEPAGDRTIQYLAEYERITNEYEKKRAELTAKKKAIANDTTSETLRDSPTLNLDELNGLPENEREEMIDKHSSDLLDWVEESKAYEASVSKQLNELEAQENAVQKQIDELDAQYKKDINALKIKYGIIK